MRTMGRLDVFDIIFYLATIGAAQADDPSHITTVYKCVIQDLCDRGERNHSRFVVLEPIINPHQRGFPVEFAGQRQGHAMPDLVCRILGPVELNMHALL